MRQKSLPMNWLRDKQPVMLWRAFNLGTRDFNFEISMSLQVPAIFQHFWLTFSPMETGF